MPYQEIKDLKLHWDMFCGAWQRWRKGDEGVTTLEMVIIGGFLIAVAGLLTVLFNNVWNADKGRISDTNSVIPSKG
jgi:hypothetical protein